MDFDFSVLLKFIGPILSLTFDNQLYPLAVKEINEKITNDAVKQMLLSALPHMKTFIDSEIAKIGA